MQKQCDRKKKLTEQNFCSKGENNRWDRDEKETCCRAHQIEHMMIMWAGGI